MTAKIKNNKKGFHAAKPSKKEIEIPVYVIKQAQTRDGSNSFLRNNNNIDDFEQKLKTVGDVDTSFFCDGNLSLNNRFSSEKKSKLERQSPQKSKFKMLTKMEIRKKGFYLSQSQKEIIMRVSVVLIAGIIFFIWFLTIKSNFSSFNLRQNNFFAVESSKDNLKDLNEEWNTLYNQWVNFQNVLKLQSAVSVNQQIISKLKEKILVEELKNQLEKSSENSQVNVNHE